MNKNAQTYYAIVSVEEELPKDENISYYTREFDGSKSTDEPPFHPVITHWLSEQQGVILSVEEWEKVEAFLNKCARGGRYSTEEAQELDEWVSNEAKQALSQLNTKP